MEQHREPIHLAPKEGLYGFGSHVARSETRAAGRDDHVDPGVIRPGPHLLANGLDVILYDGFRGELVSGVREPFGD